MTVIEVDIIMAYLTLAFLDWEPLFSFRAEHSRLTSADEEYGLGGQLTGTLSRYCITRAEYGGSRRGTPRYLPVSSVKDRPLKYSSMRSD